MSRNFWVEWSELSSSAHTLQLPHLCHLQNAQRWTFGPARLSLNQDELLTRDKNQRCEVSQDSRSVRRIATLAVDPNGCYHPADWRMAGQRRMKVTEGCAQAPIFWRLQLRNSREVKTSNDQPKQQPKQRPGWQEVWSAHECLPILSIIIKFQKWKKPKYPKHWVTAITKQEQNQ